MKKLNKVIVFGSLNMDVVVTCEKHPQTGETIFGNSVQYLPGGKGLNQAYAASLFGVRTRLIGAVGQDDAGNQLLEFLKTRDPKLIQGVARLKKWPTGTALITVSKAGDNTIVVVTGANEKAVVANSTDLSNAVGLANFEVPLAGIEQFFRAVHAGGGRTVLNPSPFRTIPETLLSETDVLILNEVELLQLTGTPDTHEHSDIQAALRILNRPGQVIIVTVGGEGCLYYCDGDLEHRPAETVKVVDTTGAGDCFAGTLCAALVAHPSYSHATYLANIAAALSTTRTGAAPSMPEREEVERYIDEQAAAWDESKDTRYIIPEWDRKSS